MKIKIQDNVKDKKSKEKPALSIALLWKCILHALNYSNPQCKHYLYVRFSTNYETSTNTYTIWAHFFNSLDDRDNKLYTHQIQILSLQECIFYKINSFTEFIQDKIIYLGELYEDKKL